MSGEKAALYGRTWWRSFNKDTGGRDLAGVPGLWTATVDSDPALSGDNIGTRGDRCAAPTDAGQVSTAVIRAAQVKSSRIPR